MRVNYHAQPESPMVWSKKYTAVLDCIRMEEPSYIKYLEYNDRNYRKLNLGLMAAMQMYD